MVRLEDFFFADFAQGPSAELYWWADDFFWLFFNCFSFYCFSADCFWKQPSFDAHGVGTVCDVAHFFGPSAPYAVTAVYRCVFGAFE
jgi:hypothetical protein